MVLLSYQSSIVQVLCHPRARLADLRERVVGLSGGTVPRLLAVFSCRLPLISSGCSFETLLTLNRESRDTLNIKEEYGLIVAAAGGGRLKQVAQ